MQRTDMKTLRQMLRYRHEFGAPQIQIAEALGVSTGGVSNLLARVRSGLALTQHRSRFRHRVFHFALK